MAEASGGMMGEARVAQRETIYTCLRDGDEITFVCTCGRDCPARLDTTLGTLVIDHGGEAIFIMPPAEWARIDTAATFRLKDTSLLPWLVRVHEYSGVDND